MGAKRDKKKGKGDSLPMEKRPGYDQEKQSAWLRSMLSAYYTLGVCIDFMQPDPSYYAEKFLVLVLTTAPRGEYMRECWKETLTSDYGHAMRLVQNEKRWYITDLDTGLQVCEDMPVWADVNSISRMRDRVEAAQRAAAEAEEKSSEG